MRVNRRTQTRPAVFMRYVKSEALFDAIRIGGYPKVPADSLCIIRKREKRKERIFYDWLLTTLLGYHSAPKEKWIIY